jgi:hypothetical protein
MQFPDRAHEGEEMHLLTHAQQACDRAYDEDQEFSSGPMPAAFSACVFLSIGLLICVLIALLLR